MDRPYRPAGATRAVGAVADAAASAANRQAETDLSAGRYLTQTVTLRSEQKVSVKALIIALWLVFIIGCNTSVDPACDTCCKPKSKPSPVASGILDTIAAARKLDAWVKAKPNREYTVRVDSRGCTVELNDSGDVQTGIGADLVAAVKDAFKE